MFVNIFFQGNLHMWLKDRNCYDQFSVIHGGGDHTSVMLNTSNEPTTVEERPVS